MSNSIKEKKDYQERINLVLNFIKENLGTHLELKTVADIGCFSPFHFHRLFKAFVGESIGSYIKRKRLEQAAQLLSFSTKPISEIGFEVGYETPSSLTNAFQKFFGCSPSHYRLNYEQFKKEVMMKPKEDLTFDLETRIENIQPIEVAFIRTKGYNSEAIGKAWNTIIPFGLQNGIFKPGQSFCIGHSLDNPDITNEEECEYHACITLNKPFKPEGEISTKTLKGGKYAIFTYKGTYDVMDRVYAYIMKDWLINSNHELRDGEIFDKYLNSKVNTATEDLLTEIHIPIQ